MLTVGVDLAKDPAATAVCTVRWDEASSAVVESVVLGADDDSIVTAATARGVDVIAIDSPFGWPAPMVSAIATWRPGGQWAAPTDAAFRLRKTDAVTADRTKARVAARRAAGESGLQSASPLSVAADKIAMSAWRCCRLLDALARREAVVVTEQIGVPFARDAQRRVVEAYPAAALAMWGVPREGYKAKEATRVRAGILDALERGAGPLRWAAGTRARCTATDHALDGFICALIARAAAIGLVEAVPPGDAAQARAEGWIALPRFDSLRFLIQSAGT